MSVVFAISIALLAAAAPIALLPGPSRLAVGPVISATGCVLLAVVALVAAITHTDPVINLGFWIGMGHSALRAGGVRAIFLALTGIAGAATSLAYAETHQPRGLSALGCLLLLCVSVMVGSTNAFLLLLAWESLGICVALLASAARDDPAALLGGYFTAGLTKVGGAALLAAIGLLYGHTHTFSIAAWAHASLSPGTRGIAFTLFLVGFGSKIGLLPVQGGIPAGYGSAPGCGPASIAVALSAGFYGLWQFEIVTLSPLPAWCGDALLIVGSLTAMTGIVYAVTQDQLRRFLGYSTIEHAGIVLLGLGVAALGASAHKPMLEAAGLLAASVVVCAHNLAKPLALLGVMFVERRSNSDSLDPLGGVARRLPVEAASTGFASMTLCALPPLGGFVGEWLTFEALLQGFRMPALLSQLLCALAAACLAFTAGIALLAFAKFYGFMFLGPERKRRAADDAAARRSRAPLSLISLGVVVLFLGAAAPWEIHALGAALTSALGFNPAGPAVTDTATQPLVLGPVFKNFSVLAPTWLMIVLPSYALLAALAAHQLGARRPVRRAPVWVTGSSAPLAEVQYRPSAYSNPLRVVLRGPLGFRTWITTPAGDGQGRPPLARLHATVVSAVDRFVYQPLARSALAANALVRRTQSGRLSVYLLYMLVALILALALIPILH